MPFSLSASSPRDGLDVLPPSHTGVTLGPLDVSTGSEQVRAFADASRSGAESVPATFPIAWLAHPAIRAAVENSLRSGEVPFHEEQVFDYREPLALNATYRLHAQLERSETPARLVLTADITRGAAPVLAIRTVLRLISVANSPNDMQAAAAQQ